MTGRIVRISGALLLVVGLAVVAALLWRRQGEQIDPFPLTPRSWIPESTAVARELGIALVEENRRDEALELWTDVAQRPDAETLDVVRLAATWFTRWVKDGGQDDPLTLKDEWASQVKRYCEQALARDESNAAAHYMIGVLANAYAMELEPSHGITHLRRAVELAPGDSGAVFHLGSALESTGEIENRKEALRLHESIVAKGKEFVGVYYLTALYRASRLNRQLGNLERSKAQSEEHKKLPQPASATQEKRDQELGSLGLIRPSSRLPKAPQGAPPAPGVSFESKPRIILERAGPVRAIDVGDFDNDGRDDVAAAGERGLFAALANRDGTFREVQLATTAGKRVVVAELENEGGLKYGKSFASLFLIEEEAVRLYHARADGSFLEDSAKLPPLAGVLDLAPVDFDHDGHLDLLFATREGIRLVRNRGVLRTDEGTRADVPVKDDAGEETGEYRIAEIAFDEITDATGFRGVAATWVAIEDFDADQDVDFLTGGGGAPTTLWSNLRRARFERLEPARTNLPAQLATRPVLGDVDVDGIADVVVLGSTTTTSRGKGDGTFEAAATRVGLASTAGARGELHDVDLDGTLDLVAAEDSGCRWWPGLGASASGAKGANSPTAVALPGRPIPGAPPLLADLDRDLDFDVVAPGPAGVELYSGSLSNPPLRVLLTLRGRKDNHGGVGTVVEVRNGNRYQRRFARRSTQLFGFERGPMPIILLTWPDGVFQYPLQTAPPNEDPDLYAAEGDPHVDLPPDLARELRAVVAQKKGPPGSCPFLYTWNGTEYVFVTDVLGATPLGLPIDEERWVQPDHDELVRITSAQLAPFEGEYRLQLTEELRETTYLDRAQLWVIDHAADVEVHPEERFCFPPFPPQKIHAIAARAIAPLARAVDQDGRDWTDELARADDSPAIPFTPLAEVYRGIATIHTLELTLPDTARSARRVRLLMTGWLNWGDASVNLALAHNGTLSFLPPVVSVPDDASDWRDCGPSVGFPAGKMKTMVLDVTSMLNRADPRLRFTSTLELYWDQIRVACDGYEGNDGDDGHEPREEPFAITKLEPVKAELWFRGFSKPIEDRRPDQPQRFDWNRLEEHARWNQHQGLLTRYGDVRPLLGEIDDRLAIFSSGDALDLRFDARSTSTPEPGMARTYLLFLDGWAKDADPNTTHSQTVEPLPFHGMSGYPYRADENYPDDAGHAGYRVEWNTRPGRRLIPDLTLRSAGEPRAVSR